MTRVGSQAERAILNPPQRGQFLRLLDRDLTNCRLGGELVGLLVVHLTGLGRINRELGYATGDAVLANTAQRIRDAVRPDDLLLRIDGVDFALIMPTLRGVGQAMLAARKIASLCAASHRVDDQILSVRPKIGAALAPDHAATAETLFGCADRALARARNSSDGLCLYEDTGQQVEESLALESDLEAALDNNELEVHFQPKIDVRSGCALGVEALSRWRHPTHGYVRPDLFIATAERNGLIEPLTQWNLNAALRTQQQAFPGLSVAVNLSALILNQADAADMVEQAIAIWGIEPGKLVLEVTESAMIDDPLKTLATLHRLDGQGVKLSIDDFGTGYSSLAYLSELPVDELKIDKSFVLNMTERGQDGKIVQSVIDLAHNLDMSVVAEGVENQATLDALCAMGCDVVQGYFFSKPLPVKALRTWLSTSQWSAARGA